MQIKQGGFRSMPDGYLHLNNYSHSSKSGLAGSLFERVMTQRQRKLVINCLLEIAEKQPPEDNTVMFKHDVYRFRKEFLQEHFQAVVYGAYRFIYKLPSSEIATAVVREQMSVEKIYDARKAAHRKDPVGNF